MFDRIRVIKPPDASTTSGRRHTIDEEHSSPPSVLCVSDQVCVSTLRADDVYAFASSVHNLHLDQRMLHDLCCFTVETTPAALRALRVSFGVVI